jgi:predicted nucleic acid-binding protein
VSWVLDTNVLSELPKPRPSPAVISWIAARIDDESRLHVSALSLAEIYRGVHRLGAQDPRLVHLRQWALTDLPLRFAGQILDFNEPVAHTWATMTAGLPRGIAIPPIDSLIAATALHHGFTLVTRNVSDMRHFSELSVENPWG